jgi:DNA primase
MDQIEEVKNKTDIVQVISEYVKLTKAGRNFKGLCPFHGEKTPSFMVNPELQIYKCFGCGEGGDVLSFVQKIEGLEFGEVLKNLAKKAGIVLKSYTPSKNEESRETLFRINNLAADFYHYLLTEHKTGEEARKYLLERKINQEAIKTFKLGFVPEGWDYLIKYLVGKKNYKLDDLTRAGLVVDGRYDRFRNRIMFPLNNHRGETVGFAGRVLPGGDEKTGKYVNTPETEIYHKGDLLYGLDVNKTEIKSAKFAVIVEGEIDAIASWQAGVKNVVAIKGSALTSKQIEILKRFTDSLTLSLDADLAGDMAARRGIETAEKSGMLLRILTAKGQGLGYKDPGEWATIDPKSWKEAVPKAVAIYDYYIQSAVDRHGLDATGKAKIGRELVPIWAKMDDEITKSHYVNKLAETLGVEANAIWQQMSKKTEETDTHKELKTEINEGETPREVRERRVVQVAILGNKIEELTGEVAEFIKTDFWKKVVEELKKEKDIKLLPAELRDKVVELVMTDEEYEAGLWEEACRLVELLDVKERLNSGAGVKEADKLAKRKGELTLLK